jgi:glycylpeptide N-tetradecanoyltransferase
VEDTDSIFRFNYSKEFLRWATTPTGFKPDWMVGVRKRTDKKPLAFISGIPCQIRIGDKSMLLCEINFLCIHKVLRSKRLAPILIKEVTRRVNLCDIWQAIYTAGIELPKPVAKCQYFHRSLNPQKLVSIGFSRIPPHFQKLQRPMDAMKRALAVGDHPSVRGLRPMVRADVPAVTELLRVHLQNYRIAPDMSPEDVEHWILPHEGVVYSYVVETDGVPTDFISFYGLPSTVLGNAQYNDLKAAYCYYYATTTVPLKNLVSDALVMAKQLGFDVFNMLNIMLNMTFQEELKFGQGDGFLRYYLFNWKFPTIQPKELGLVML